MADFAPQYTARIQWLYAVQSHNHVATFRFERGMVLADAGAAASEIAGAIQPFMTARGYIDLTTRGWQFAPEDSTVYLPIVGAPAVTGGATITGRPKSQAATQLTIPWRTTLGGHGFLNFYGTNYNLYATDGEDFRIQPGEDADLSAMIVDLGLIGLRGGDNAPIVLKEYGNVGFNARWKKRVRNG